MNLVMSTDGAKLKGHYKKINQRNDCEGGRRWGIKKENMRGRKKQLGF